MLGTFLCIGGVDLTFNQITESSLWMTTILVQCSGECEVMIKNTLTDLVFILKDLAILLFTNRLINF